MRVYASLDDDISEGFVWFQTADLPARCVVKITNPATRRSVFCEALQFEENFLRRYNQPPRYSISSPESAIVMSRWFRARLGDLETQREYPLNIRRTRSWVGKIRAGLGHPQVVVRVAVWLGLLSVALGVLSVPLSIVTMWPTAVSSRPRAWNPGGITAQFADMYVQPGERVTVTFHYTLENHARHDHRLPDESALYLVLTGGKGLQRDKTLRWVGMSPVPVGQRINVGIELAFDYTEAYPYADRGNLEKLNSFIKRRLAEMDGFMALDEGSRFEIRFPKPPEPKG